MSKHPHKQQQTPLWLRPVVRGGYPASKPDKAASTRRRAARSAPRLPVRGPDSTVELSRILPSAEARHRTRMEARLCTCRLHAVWRTDPDHAALVDCEGRSHDGLLTYLRNGLWFHDRDEAERWIVTNPAPDGTRQQVVSLHVAGVLPRPERESVSSLFPNPERQAEPRLKIGSPGVSYRRREDHEIS